jgi:hypothetical protein
MMSPMDSVDGDCNRPTICILSDKNHLDFANWSRAIESASDFFSILAFGVASTLTTYWKTLSAKAEICWAMRSALTEEEQNLMNECDKFSGLQNQTDEEKRMMLKRRSPMKKLAGWWGQYMQTAWVRNVLLYIFILFIIITNNHQ